MPLALNFSGSPSNGGLTRRLANCILVVQCNYIGVIRLHYMSALTSVGGTPDSGPN